MYKFWSKLCKEKGLTITKLCTIVTGNSGNLATWQKGYMRSDYLSKCADVLGVSTDYLLQRQVLNAELSENETELLSLFRACPDADKENIILLARSFAERETSAKEKEKISV